MCPKRLHNRPLRHPFLHVLVGGWVDGGMVVRVWSEVGGVFFRWETGFEGLVGLLG
jgi:hypothetical protein